MTKKVCVLGAGSWGSALSFVLAENNLPVLLWSRNEDQVKEISNLRTNKRYLKGFLFPSLVNATNVLKEAVSNSDIIVFAVPSGAMREVAKEVNKYIDEGVSVLHVSKGFEAKTHKRMSEVLLEELEGVNHVGVLSGPSHAEEVIKKFPTTVVASSKDTCLMKLIQSTFSNDYFRVYTNEDVLGVELAGALKNIIGLASGLIAGLGFGDNTKAALITRGLSEITKLASKMGANSNTLSGLTGLGDLIVTCTSIHSRNYRAGKLLGEGKTLSESLGVLGMVVEGVKTTEVVYELAKKHEVVMPITQELYKVLFFGETPSKALENLMKRENNDELGESYI